MRTTPASTRPMKAMNSPMPTEIAERSVRGTALKIARRKPVITRMVISTPSQTTRPMACGQVICGAMVYATTAFRPRPVASAIGKRA